MSVHVFRVAVTIAACVILGPAASATAEPGVPPAPPPPGCPDVQVLFARGTTEPPGLGAVGDAFVDDLKSRVAPKSVAVYPVNYPASPDFPTALQGVVDASTQIQNTANACPKTSMVLGGYSQGAAVMGFVTSEVIPDGVTAADVPAVMPPTVADHIAAVALLGTPSDRFMGVINQPTIKIGSLYQPKTVELCVPGDFVCSPGNDIGAHARYISDGLVDQAADFAASKVAEHPESEPAR
ncbi:cutinase family protein [Mycobacterium sp. PSTR-4-N]|uniref:cutinase family protein n=1 Tax=Mycobacterium sp. PSTR-4-N TaxID=2917745 RepID=UPI0035B28BFA